MRQGSSRHPVEVEGIGIMQHGKEKTYMFSVLWSDHNKLLIYRTMQEFKKLQKELKETFPLEAGAMKKSERTIPKFKEASQGFTKKKNSGKFLEQLRRLESYSQALLKLDGKISQSALVVGFFNINRHDLNPSFPENSLMIMPSDYKEQTTICTNHNPGISGPLVSPSYFCVDNFETTDLKNKPFKVKKRELLDVLMKESTGWWLVENEDRQIAWFPAPYLKHYQNTEEEDHTILQCKGMFCVVIKTYEAQNSDELSVSIGGVVEVLQKSNHGWWLISYNRRTGYIPSICLKPYKNPCEKFQNLLGGDRYFSTPNLYDTRHFFPHRGSLDSHVGSGGNIEDRARSHSTGNESLTSDLRESSSSSVSEDESSVAGSSFSLSTDEPAIPIIPARPKPDEIMQRCCTVTKRAVQGPLSRPSLTESVVEAQLQIQTGKEK
ncbi:hypothetical protein GDO86_017567 [Hymenochirus boettgeri]|uniref:NADPH oxidase organizer 1 n=1 Tax=Hymenochirus boettgeri TaxID=247094 RepID=A0A8T2IQG6_9PIPI|nr:hypothetical protein GDO86_017567 [Hymenochirus boettgeri]